MADRLNRDFFVRPAAEVGPDLLGCTLAVTTDDGAVALRLTEVEAYAGTDDPASHAWRGPTPRTAIMFGPAAHLYLYLVYGMHWCANIVTGPDGVAGAVLLRGGEVTSGHGLAATRRGLPPGDPRTARGPAGLVTSLGLTAADNGADLMSGRFALIRGVGTAPDAIVRGPRVGLTRAVETPWRFHLAGAPGVTAFRAGGKRRKPVDRE